jgi:hypothetical protein
VPRHFGYGPCSHHGDHPPRKHGFPVGGSYTRFETIHLDGPHFPRRGSWLSARFLSFISLTPALSHLPLRVLCR